MAALPAAVVHTQVQSAARATIEFIANYLVTCNSEALMMTFAILGLIAFLGISLIPIYILRRREYARAREYFVASEPTPAGVVQNSSLAYSIQMTPLPQFFSSR